MEFHREREALLKHWVCRGCHYSETSEQPPDSCPVCHASGDTFEEMEDGTTEPEIRRPLRLMMPASVVSWRCQVCAAEHEGSQPPDVCPVCGVGPELWDQVATSRAKMDTDPTPLEGSMICTVCGTPLGIEAPTTCRLCGARRVWLRRPPHQVGSSVPPQKVSSPRRYVILGSGIAALRASESIRSRDASAQITMLTREPCLPYYRCNLTRFFDGNLQAASIMLHAPEWYAERGIVVRLETEARSLDTGKHMVRTQSGDLAYDRLVIATGCRVALPSIPRLWLDGVVRLRTLEDCANLLAASMVGRRLVVLGGGILGVEAAAAARRRGCEVTICERGDRLMPHQLDATAARLLQNHLDQWGVRVRLGCEATSIEGDESVRGVHIGPDEWEPADLVLIATGIVPNVSLARAGGLATNHGILVNEACQTSDPDVLAAGDCVEIGGATFGAWSFAMDMGNVAGINTAGGTETFSPPWLPRIPHIVDLDLCSMGRISASGPAEQEIVHSQGAGTAYQKIIVDRGRIVGAILLGDTDPAAAITEAMRTGANVSQLVAGAGSLLEILSSLPRPGT